MKLYSLKGCPMCDVAKETLIKKNISFEYITDAEEITKRGITHVPVLETEDGNLLSGKPLMQYLNSLQGA